MNEAITEAEDMGVEFVYDVDKEAFREATAGMIDEYREEYPGVADRITARRSSSSLSNLSWLIAPPQLPRSSLANRQP